MAPRPGARGAPLSAASPPAIEHLPGPLERNDRSPVGAAPARDERETPAGGSAPRRNLTPAPPQERLRHLAQQIHRLGERPLYELFRELEAGAPLLPRLEAYARLDPEFIRALGGDRLPPPHIVPGGRDDAA